MHMEAASIDAYIFSEFFLKVERNWRVQKQ